MKRAAFILILSVFLINCRAQDLIVTTSRDSMNCKITRITDEGIYFKFTFNGEVRNTMIPITKVSEHRKGFYKTNQVQSESKTGNNYYKPVRFALNLGPGYRTAKIDEVQSQELINYLNKSRWGFQIGGSFTYYIDESFGLGVNWNRYMYSGSTTIRLEDPFGHTDIFDISEDIDMSLYAPTFSSRFLSGNKKNTLVLRYSIGFLTYRNYAHIDRDYTITGNTLGTAFDFGYDFSISKNLQLGVQLSVYTGSLKSFKITDRGYSQIVDLEKGQYENLSRIYLSMGFRFIL